VVTKTIISIIFFLITIPQSLFVPLGQKVSLICFQTRL